MNAVLKPAAIASHDHAIADLSQADFGRKEIKIAATTVPRFTAGAGFKAAVAGKKAAKKK